MNGYLRIFLYRTVSKMNESEVDTFKSCTNIALTEV